ncbi:putative intracellular protein transport-like protein [Erysiphe neolycopersici]|uniref:Putative intracellular protein transport-like protein n=1 Tax=Erysiphe neolycopersici TaxID=212602 RepID=A0A420HR35_9PEZI|nr:putative intracellular protein transport-like protein [Erysiphe neolycopersici]
MDVAHHTSSNTRGQSDTPLASESAYMTSSDLSFVHQDSITKPQSLEFIRRREKPLVSSVPSLVRRKPLPPNACRQVTRLSSPEDPILSSELSPQISSLPPVAIDVSFFTKIDFPPWEGANLTSSVDEVQGYTGQNTNILQQRNTLPSQMSQNLAISKLPSSSIIFTEHSKATSCSTSLFSEETTTVSCDNPGSTAISVTGTSLPPTETKPSRKRITTFSCPDDSGGSDLSPSRSSMSSPKPSLVASLFSWREKISTSLPSTSTSIESSSPKLPNTPDKDDKHSYFSSTPDEKLSILPAPPANVQSQVVPIPGTDPQVIVHDKRPSPIMDDMERELKEISSELASSIKREMELEDEVERLKADAQNSSASSDKRTSDYFSDYGSGFTKYGNESESKRDELDRLIRKAELSKAQMKLEITKLTLTVNEERAKRKQLEQKIQDLEEKASHINRESTDSTDTSERIRELESTCEELRKRLAEEQQLKETTDETLAMLRSQLHISISERDNLRDEVVPQLRSQVEGLEMQATEYEKTTYEQTKVHQALQELGSKSMALIDSQKKQIEEQNQLKTYDRYSQIIETVEKRDSSSYSSNRILYLRPRSNTIMNVPENRDRTAERIRDVELQRDALHDSLKSLRERQEHQNRENQKHIKHLEMELEKALSVSPKRSGYEREVKQLRAEINTLRLRADEALSQKLKFAENIAVLKNELEHAEQEIVGLKKLLMLEKHGSQVSQKRPTSENLASESLEDSLKDLQITFSKSLEQVKCLQAEDLTRENLDAFRLMEQSFARVIYELNYVSHQAEMLKKQNKILLRNEKALSVQELTHSKELLESAKRFEDLAIQVRQQLNTNATLRQRLTSMIECEEMEQELSAQKIKYLQERVKTLEEQLYIAQNSSEERLLAHEEEIREMKENQIDQILRIKEGIRSPTTSALARSIKSPRNFFLQSPVAEDVKVAHLRQRISELEKALSDANQEIAKVVSHMKAAQIQVMDLQNEREEAIQKTKRLQRLVEQENAQAYPMTWKSMLSFGGRELKV